MLDYALVANDPQLKEWVRDCYEFVRQMGIPRLGIIAQGPEAAMEGCVIGDMTALAVALSDAGMGDYWDDVDCIARNALVSGQAADLEELKRVSMEGRVQPVGSQWGGLCDDRFLNNNRNRGSLAGQEIYDHALERTIGAYSHLSGARYQKPLMMSCCTANGNQGFYFAWEGITRRNGNLAEVNLWLNRRSPWLDVWSWLPYEGKLVMQNKGMQQIVEQYGYCLLLVGVLSADLAASLCFASRACLHRAAQFQTSSHGERRLSHKLTSARFPLRRVIPSQAK